MLLGVLVLPTGVLDDGVAVVHTFRRPSNVNRVEARRLLLTAAALDVTTRTVVTWVLDSQHEHQAAMDRITLDRALRGLAGAPVYDHRPAATDPLLRAVDAIVWAYGAGGDWRRRIAHLVDVRPLEP